MLLGILFVLAGILIAIYPPLLSMIVAAFLIIIGVIMLSIHYHYRKVAKDSDNPFMKFIIRF